MHNVFKAEGRRHKGDLADCINQEMLVNGDQNVVKVQWKVLGSSGFIGGNSSLPRFFILATLGSQH